MPPNTDAPNEYLAFQQRLAECIKAGGGTAKALAAKAGIPNTTFARYLKGTEPPRDAIVSIARAVGATSGWLADGVGRSPGEVETTVPSLRDAPLEGYYKVPIVTGSHRENDGTRKLDFFAKKAWLPTEIFSDGLKGADPNELGIMRMTGNEMEPFVLDGEIVVFGISERYREPREGNLVVRIKDNLTVRSVFIEDEDSVYFRHLGSPEDSKGFRVLNRDLGKTYDILGRFLIRLMYPINVGRPGKSG